MEFNEFNNHIEKIYNLIQDLKKLNSKHIEYLNSFIIEFKKHEMIGLIHPFLEKVDTKEFAFSQPGFTNIKDINDEHYQIPVREDFTTCLVLLSLLGSKHSINEIEKRLEAKNIFENFNQRLLNDYKVWIYPGIGYLFDNYTTPFKLKFLKRYNKDEPRSDYLLLALFSLTNNIFRKDLEFEDHQISAFLLYEIADAIIAWLDYFPEFNIVDKICQILESNVIIAKFIVKESFLVQNFYQEFNKIFHKTITKKVKDEHKFNDIEFLQIFNNEFENYKLSQSNEFEKLKDMLETKQLDAIKKVITESTLKDFLPTRTSIELKFLKKVFEWSEKQLFQQLSFHKIKDIGRIDPITCVYALKIYIICNEFFKKKYDYHLQIDFDQKLVDGTIQSVFDDFQGGYLWRKNLPVFNASPQMENIYPFGLASLNEILSIMEVQELEKQNFDSIYQAINWIFKNELSNYRSVNFTENKIHPTYREKTYSGWRSPQSTFSGNPEAWITALVFELTFSLEHKLREYITYMIIKHLKNGEYRPKKLVVHTVNEDDFLKNTMDSVFEYKSNNKFGKRLSLKRTLYKSIKEQNNAFVLYGPPGTGKSTLVSSIAKNIGYSFLRVDTSTLLREGINNASKSVDNIFNLINKLEYTVILFDEIDECIKERESNTTTFENRILTNTLLTKLNDIKGNKIIYFVNTNLISEIDKAIKREGRFDAILHVDHPYIEELVFYIRSKLWDLYHDNKFLLLTEEKLDELSNSLLSIFNSKGIVSFPYKLFKRYFDDCIQEINLNTETKSYSWNIIKNIFTDKLNLIVDTNYQPSNKEMIRLPSSIKDVDIVYSSH